MPAAKKITPLIAAQLLQRRCEGASNRALERESGISNQAIGKFFKNEDAKHAAELDHGNEQAREQAEAAAVPTRDQRPRQRPQPANPVVRHPLLPTVFADWDQRLAYYEHHQLESESDWLNYKDAVNGRETPAERRARTRGLPLRIR